MKKALGRPRLAKDVAYNEYFCVRLTKAQALKVKGLGGSRWVRARIERAKVAG